MDKEEEQKENADELSSVLKDLEEQRKAAIEFYGKDRTDAQREEITAEIARDLKEKDDDRADLAYYREVETKRQDERITRAAEDDAFHESRGNSEAVDKLTQASKDAQEEQ